MKPSKLFSVLFLSVLFFNLSYAQQKLANSVLWKIERADLDAPSYLFGSLHIMCENDFNVPQKVSDALETTEAIVLEVNLSDPKEMQKLQNAMLGAKKISEELSKENYYKLDTLVTKVLGTPLQVYDAYGLSVLNSVMITKMLPCSKFKSLETELTLMAKKRKKPIFGLESASQQIESLKKAYPADFAFKQLMLFESYKKDFNATIALYNQEDITSGVASITKEMYMDKNAITFMLIERNKNWIKKMPQMMKERSNLFVVGVAHLVNNYGIIQLLREKGYTVTPVTK